MDTSSKGRTYFLLILLAGVTIVSFFVFRPFLTTVALSAVFAVILHPLYKRILKAVRGHKSVASLATLIIATVCVLIPLVIVGTLVVNEARHAYSAFASGNTELSVDHVAVSVGAWLEPNFPGATEYAHSISQELNAYLSQSLQWLLGRVGSAFTGILSLLLHLLIFFMTLYYLLKEGSAIEKSLTKLSPIADEEASAIFTKLSRTINSVVKGSLAIACIQGTLAGIGYTIFGLPNATLWGISTAISALIPGVGTSLVLIPAVTFLFVTGNIGGGVGLLIWGTFLVGLIDNFLAPKLMGKGAALHPLVILLSVLGGVSFFGPVGIFIGPLTISLLISVYAVYAGKTVEVSK